MLFLPTLAVWLENQATSMPERLSIVLEQYAELCQRIANGDRKPIMNKKIRPFLTDPSNLEVALEIETYLQGVKQFIFQSFWREVCADLQHRLDSSGHGVFWETRLDDNIFQSYSGLEIVWVKAPTSPQCMVRAECLSGRPYSAYYCLSRGVDKKQLDDREQMLKAQLKRDGFRSEGKWLGYRYFNDLQLPHFSITRSEDVIRLNQDIIDPSHPLARRVAELVWNFFDIYHVALEALNQNHPS